MKNHYRSLDDRVDQVWDRVRLGGCLFTRRQPQVNKSHVPTNKSALHQYKGGVSAQCRVVFRREQRQYIGWTIRCRFIRNSVLAHATVLLVRPTH